MRAEEQQQAEPSCGLAGKSTEQLFDLTSHKITPHQSEWETSRHTWYVSIVAQNKTQDHFAPNCDKQNNSLQEGRPQIPNSYSLPEPHSHCLNGWPADLLVCNDSLYNYSPNVNFTRPGSDVSSSGVVGNG